MKADYCIGKSVLCTGKVQYIVAYTIVYSSSILYIGYNYSKNWCSLGVRTEVVDLQQMHRITHPCFTINTI